MNFKFVFLTIITNVVTIQIPFNYNLYYLLFAIGYLFLSSLHYFLPKPCLLNIVYYNS